MAYTDVFEDKWIDELDFDDEVDVDDEPDPEEESLALQEELEIERQAEEQQIALHDEWVRQGGDPVAAEKRYREDMARMMENADKVLRLAFPESYAARS